jgi:hypothetical protein
MATAGQAQQDRDVPMTHPTVKRAKVTVESVDLACNVRRAVGWTSICECGERFPIRRDRQVAQHDLNVHTAVCQGKAPAS